MKAQRLPSIDVAESRVIVSDCVAAMAAMAADSVDCICTDPPYGLSFMAKEWDHGVPGVPFWAEALRVAKPGAWLTAFGGTRTYHRLTCAIEDAGWEIRDCLMWLYGAGFPKSLDVSKAVDKAAGAEREIVGEGPRSSRTPSHKPDPALNAYGYSNGSYIRPAGQPISRPATDLAKLYAGYGTALKPAYEPIVLARKPLVGTVAANVQRFGTGGLNIDGSRVESGLSYLERHLKQGVNRAVTSYQRNENPMTFNPNENGRWPPNVLLDEGVSVGGASRFFPRFHYTGKASRAERDGSRHPTVKPLEVIRWLVRLTSPPGKPTILDPFLGSGTTGVVCAQLDLDFIGIEINPDYAADAERRIAKAREG